MFDLIVVGGGILGAMTAWRAHKYRPEARIALVEMGLPGSGITAASGGHCQPFGRTPELRSWATEARTTYLEISEKFGAAPIWRMELVAVSSASTVEDNLRRYVEPPLFEGAAEVLAQDDLNLSESDRVLGRVSSLVCEPGVLANSLCHALIRNGIMTAYFHCKVQNLEQLSEVVHVILADTRVVSAAHVVIATGNGIIEQQFFPDPHIDLRAIPIKKIASFFLPRETGGKYRGYYFVNREIGLFARPDLDGWLLSVNSPVWAPDETVIGADDLEVGRSALSTVAPNWQCELIGGWVSREGYPCGRKPVITSVPDWPQLAIIGACAGFGVRAAPSLARLALEQIGWVNS